MSRTLLQDLEWEYEAKRILCDTVEMEIANLQKEWDKHDRILHQKADLITALIRLDWRRRKGVPRCICPDGHALDGGECEPLTSAALGGR